MIAACKQQESCLICKGVYAIVWKIKGVRTRNICFS